MMSLTDYNESGFSESDIHFARRTFFRDCPNGRCSKQKFLAFIRKTSLQKPTKLNIHTLRFLQTYRQSKKFFSMMFDIYDRNHDGELDFDEYLYALSAISGANRVRTIETLFHFFDINNQGFITQDEFNSRKKLAAQFLGQYKTGINDHLLHDQAFKEMDFDKDGKISKDEFIQWHLKDHLTIDNTKHISKRARLFKNLSNFVDISGEIKTSSLQQKKIDSVDHWLETTMNIDHNHDQQQQHELTSNIHVDRYLLNIFRRARHRFHHEKHRTLDDQSDSGVFTLSSKTTLTDEDFDINNNTDDDFQSIITTDNTDDELLCQSLEVVLMETLIQLREQRKRLSSKHLNSSIKQDQQSIVTRL